VSGADGDASAAGLEEEERVGAKEAVTPHFLAADDALEQAGGLARIDLGEGGERGEAVGEQPAVDRHEPADAGGRCE